MQLRSRFWLVLLSFTFLLNGMLIDQLTDLRASLQTLLNQLQAITPPISSPEPLTPKPAPKPSVGKKYTAEDATHFIVLKVPTSKYGPYGELIRELKESLGEWIGFKGLPFQFLHLTLAYLVDVKPAQERKIESIISEALREYKRGVSKPLKFEYGVLEAIGSRGYIAAVLPLYLKEDPNEPICKLVSILHRKLKENDIELAYGGGCLPHITIGKYEVDKVLGERDESTLIEILYDIAKGGEWLKKLEIKFHQVAFNKRGEHESLAEFRI